jgi:hypothetical protein
MWVYRQPAFPQRPFYRRSGHRQTNFKKITSHELLYLHKFATSKTLPIARGGAERCEKKGSLGGIGHGPGPRELETKLGRVRGRPGVSRRRGRARDGDVPQLSDGTARGWTGS